MHLEEKRADFKPAARTSVQIIVDPVWCCRTRHQFNVSAGHEVNKTRPKNRNTNVFFLSWSLNCSGLFSYFWSPFRLFILSLFKQTLSSANRGSSTQRVDVFRVKTVYFRTVGGCRSEGRCDIASVSVFSSTCFHPTTSRFIYVRL